MSVMDKAFGKSRPEPQIEGEVLQPERPLTAQEKMMIAILKQVAPGIDLGAIAQLGKNAEEFAGRVGATLTAHSEALARIEENQAAILAHIAGHSDRPEEAR